MKQYHIVDLFAGVGGLSYGFSQLPGYRILAANVIEKDIAETEKILTTSNLSV